MFFSLLFPTVHSWLHDEVGILHRDLSQRNFMCRFIDDQVYGVLMDYDISSWVYMNNSRQRVGTPPYMAQELLKGTSAAHLYRHDIESLFYIMLLTCARHSFEPVKGEGEENPTQRMVRLEEFPYLTWFTQQNDEALGNEKFAFIVGKEPIKLSPDFEDFEPWLRDIRYCFSEGFKAKLEATEEEPPQWMLKGGDGFLNFVEHVPFDDDTLGGHVEYSSIIRPIQYLGGELKDLIVRYRP